jgi:hypothetical protein
MTVILFNRETKSLNLFCKGSPETIVKLCDPSKIPSDFKQQLESLTV